MSTPTPTFVVTRFAHGADATLGILYHGSEALCFVLEDEYRAVKVPGETRIPDGTYRLRLRDWGGFHERYAKQFAGLHVGMIELLEIPGFSDVLIHVGNTDDDTAGCLLIGDSAARVLSSGDWSIGDSRQAYRRVYPIIAGEIQERSTWLRVQSVGAVPVDPAMVA